MKFGKIKNVILFGAGTLLTECALKLKKEKIPLFVVTSQRHIKEAVIIGAKSVSLKYFLEANMITYHISPDITSDPVVLKHINAATLGISFGAAWIFKQSFIDRFKGRLVNIHGSRLPQNRGGGGFSWQIMRNNRLGFALIHLIDIGVDTGKIVKYAEFIYPISCRTSQQYSELYIENNRRLIFQFLDEVKNEIDFPLIIQQEYFSIHWPRLATEIHGFIDWQWSLKDIESFICAFDAPYKGASTFMNGKRVFLKACFSDFNDGGFHPFQKGIVYRLSQNMVFIAAEGGSLLISSVLDENGRDMKDEIAVGDRFYTPIKYLEQAKILRAVYTPQGLKSA